MQEDLYYYESNYELILCTPIYNIKERVTLTCNNTSGVPSTGLQQLTIKFKLNWTILIHVHFTMFTHF